MRRVREVGGGRRGFPHPVSCFWANCAFGGGQRRMCSPQKSEPQGHSSLTERATSCGGVQGTPCLDSLNAF